MIGIQEIATIASVSFAIAFLIRRVYLLLTRSKAPGCGDCSRTDFVRGKQLVEIDLPPRNPKSS